MTIKVKTYHVDELTCDFCGVVEARQPGDDVTGWLAIEALAQKKRGKRIKEHACPMDAAKILALKQKKPQ